MSSNSAIGHDGDDPHNSEDSTEVSSHREGGGSVRPSQIRGKESRAPRGSEGEASINAEQAAFMRNLLNLLRQAALNLTTMAPPPKRDSVFDLKKMGAEKFYGDKTDLGMSEDWLVSTSRVLKTLKCTPEEKLRCI